MQEEDYSKFIRNRMGGPLYKNHKELQERLFEVSNEGDTCSAKQLRLCALHNLIAAFSVFFETKT